MKKLNKSEQIKWEYAYNLCKKNYPDRSDIQCAFNADKYVEWIS